MAHIFARSGGERHSESWLGLANRQLCDGRRSADLIRVTAGMRHGHALYRPGHCEAAGKTCHEDTGGKCKQGQERDGGDLRAGCSAHHCHTLVLQKPARDAASAQPAPSACASCGRGKSAPLTGDLFHARCFCLKAVAASAERPHACDAVFQPFATSQTFTR